MNEISICQSLKIDYSVFFLLETQIEITLSVPIFTNPNTKRIENILEGSLENLSV